MNRFLPLFGASLLVLPMFAVFAADDAKKAAPARPALTVTVAKPQAAQLGIRLEANGNIAAWQETIVGAEVSGLRLVEVRANVGDAVVKGQVLAVFSAETTEAEVAQQEAAVAVAEAELGEAQSNANRRKALADSGAASKQEVEQYLTAARSAEARLASARAAARAAKVRLGNARVLAPDAGVISARTATVGTVAQPGQELFRLIRNGRLEWRAEVTADDLARVRVGQPVSLALPGGGTAKGKVRMLAPTVDPQTRNAIVYVDLVGNSPARAGMFARGVFDLGQSDALTVPQQSVVVRDGFSFVFVVGNDNRVTARKVSAGRRNADRIEILEGLKPDATVVASGAGFLNEGDLVAVGIAAAPAPATKAPVSGEGAKARK
jgi:HlyD family secretion protein